MTTPSTSDDLGTLMKVFTDSVREAMLAKPSKSHAPKRQLRTRQADKYISFLERVGETFGCKLTGHLVEQRQRRNEQLAINKLPPELLVKTFSLYLQDRSTKLHVRQLHVLAQVCTRWLELVKHSASLWGVISTDELESFRLALAKSKSSPLDIKFLRYRNLASIHSQVMEEFKEAVFSQSYRWHSLQLVGDTADFEKAMILLAPLRLVDLDISHEPPSPYYPTAGVVETIIPEELLSQLRHLSLAYVSLRWNPSALSRLRTLKLGDLSDKGRPSLSTLISILHASPRLEELRIAGKSVDISPLERHTPLELPSLTIISLKASSDIIQHLLILLRIPQCTYFFLDILPGSPQNIFDTSIMHVEECLRSIITSCDKIEVTLSPNRIRMASKAVNAEFGLSRPLHSPPDPLRWFDGLLESIIPQPSVVLSIHGWDWAAEECPILKSTSNIIRLTITYSETDALRWIERLSEPVTSSEGAHWQLPRLKWLTFSECRSYGKPLLAMIRRRYGKAETGGESVYVDSDERESGEDTGGGMGRAKAKTSQRLTRHSHPDRMSKSGVDVDQKIGGICSAQLPAPLEGLSIMGQSDVRYSTFVQLEQIVGGSRVVWEDPDDVNEGDEYYDEYGYGFDNSSGGSSFENPLG
ncbi:hypothetical protein FRB97_008066 [Tulasnella sp. 331]|nr:hypothetical protein FRB97_008066 [Tulasnella sp. 331]